MLHNAYVALCMCFMCCQEWSCPFPSGSNAPVLHPFFHLWVQNYLAVEGKTGPNSVQQGQTGQTRQNVVKWGCTGPNGVKWCQRRPNQAIRDHMKPREDQWGQRRPLYSRVDCLWAYFIRGALLYCYCSHVVFL